MPRDKENYRKWKREWYQKNRTKEIARKKKYHLTPEGRKVLYESIKRYRIKYPEKQRARQIIQARLRRGTMKAGICKCGRDDTQAHHSDYSKPLEVVWLCSSCHGEEHTKLSCKVTIRA